MYLYADLVHYNNGVLNVVGWYGPSTPERTMEIKVTSGGKEIPYTVEFSARPDVSYALFKDPSVGKPGFFMQIPCKRSAVVKLTGIELLDGKEVDRDTIVFNQLKDDVKQKAMDVKKYLNGYRKPIRHALRKDYHQYAAWFQSVRATPMEIAAQKKETFAYAPLISILVPVYHTPEAFLTAMIGSVLDQSYGNFELILANATPDDKTVSGILSKYEKLDSRVRVLTLEKNGGISENTNAALKAAKGAYIAMLDHDDMIEADALYEYVKRLNVHPEADLLYCDEDKIRESSDYFYYPNFKPDFNRDMLFNNNYICHMLMVRKTLAEKVGGFDPAFDGAQDYDLILKCICESRNIEHIDKVLYHWRSCKTSTSKRADKKNYAIDASVKAIENCYDRMGIKGKVHPTGIAGWYESEYELIGNPLVSVLIPNKDHTDDLDVVIRSLEEKCTYRNFEVIVIENNSTEDQTFQYYKEAEEKYENVHVVYYDQQGFNYSRINNFGFRASKGDYIMLLNNDVEVITPNMFESMLGYAQRQDVGMVGAKLLFKDKTIQHAGVLAGAGGLADHYFKGEKSRKPGYMCRAVTSYDVSAVTAACALMRRSVFEEVGGLEEELAVAFNDVDLCMKVRAAGYLIVYDAQAQLFHYESKSRGVENTPEKFLRFGRESKFINDKWKMLVDFHDPYYNKNMSYMIYFELNLKRMEERTEEFTRYFNDLQKQEN